MGSNDGATIKEDVAGHVSELTLGLTHSGKGFVFLRDLF